MTRSAAASLTLRAAAIQKASTQRSAPVDDINWFIMCFIILTEQLINSVGNHIDFAKN
jgi:hypothetical protein